MGLRLKKSEANPDGRKKPIRERIENIRTNWNRFRAFLKVDTTKSKW